VAEISHDEAERISLARQHFADVLEALAPEVRQGTMMGRPNLIAAGTMVACLHQDVFGVRLGRNSAEFARAMAVPGAALFDPSGKGRPFKDWVGVPVAAADEWLPLCAALLARRHA
jgi:hypothetical protein